MDTILYHGMEGGVTNRALHSAKGTHQKVGAWKKLWGWGYFKMSQASPQGIACAPQIWMDYITLILSELEDNKKYIAIMDDLLIHSTKVDHWKLLEQLLKSMCKNGLRLSPKKCQLFKTNLIYMGNEFTINRRTRSITPLRSRTEAINKIPTPRTPKQCKSFCGVVNYL